MTGVQKIRDHTKMLKLANVFILIVYSSAFFFLFCQQYYNATESSYPSDLWSHINESMSGEQIYSLMRFIMGKMGTLPFAGYWIAVLLDVLLLFSVFATKTLLQFLLPDRNKWLLYIYSWVSVAFFPLTIINYSSYSGIMNYNLVHNSTYMAMKPFAIFSIYFFFKLYDSIRAGKVTVKDSIKLMTVVTISTVFKPNFTIGFSFALLFVLIYEFVRAHGKNIINCLKVGCSVLPSVVIVLYQQSQWFDDTAEIQIGFMTAMNAISRHPWINMAEALAFVLIVLFFTCKDSIKDKRYVFVWLLFVSNLMLGMLLYEDGHRLLHGNFLWGVTFACCPLVILSIQRFDGFVLNKSMVRLVLSSGVLGAHIFSWIKFCHDIMLGSCPY